MNWSSRLTIGPRPAVAVAALFAAAVAAQLSPAAAQSGVDGPSRRAEEDYQALAQTAEAALDGAAGALSAAAAHPLATALLALVSAVVGALARGWFAPQERASARAPAAAATLRRPPPPPSGRGDGMIFRDAQTGRPEPAREAASERDPEALREAERLFEFFESRFGLDDRRADAAIAYLERLSGAIERLRARADAPPRAPEPEPAAEAHPADAAWTVALDAVRTARAALAALERDADAAAFGAETNLEAALRSMARARSAAAGPDGRALDPATVEELWPHAIWRAEALLTTYYPTDARWRDLREGVGAASAALRLLLRYSGVVVGQARLLAPYAADDGEKWTDSSAGLIELAPVRSAVRRLAVGEAAAQDGARAPLVIDCESFAFADHARGVSARARLVVLAPAAWL